LSLKLGEAIALDLHRIVSIQIINAVNVMAFCQQSFRQKEADKTCRTGHQDCHCLSAYPFTAGFTVPDGDRKPIFPHHSQPG
jgi:hypothetical protein